MKDEKESYLSVLLKSYFIEAKKHYPNFSFSSRFSVYDVSEPTTCELELGFDAKCIRGTEYELSEKSNLIHYTSSVQSVIEILNSGSLRLGNLVSVNDPQEISFIANNLNIPNFSPDVISLRSTFFSASFCKVIDEKKPDDFPMWRLYGTDGYGAAIIFEIENYDQDWLNFVLAQVQYGDCESVKRFIDFVNFHNGFQELNNFPIQNIPKTFTAFLALHKNHIWKYENEIRLLTQYDYNEYSLENVSEHICQLKHSISNKNKQYSYVELPLTGGKEYNRIKDLGRLDALNSLLPIFKVKEIILGYRIDSKSYMDIITVVNYISRGYGYHIAVRESHLKEYMI